MAVGKLSHWFAVAMLSFWGIENVTPVKFIARNMIAPTLCHAKLELNLMDAFGSFWPLDRKQQLHGTRHLLA